ncbi:MAG: terminase family protein [Telluria sp.]
MAVSLQTQRELSRWYKLTEHPVQRALVDAVANGVRFPVVPAGRRSGKTERAKRFVAKMAMKNPGERYFIAAPTHAQVKKMYWSDMKQLCLCSLQSKAPSESDLIIFMGNGTEIHLIGLDRPQRIEGVFWSGGVIDEIADIKPDAWEANIRPALDTFNPTRPDYRAWCWLIGVPDGLNHYYDMAKYAESANDPDWALFHWKSSEILPAETIAAAKRQMSAKQYKQEYEASFEGATGRIYEDYDKANHTDAAVLPHEQLMWMHDQNFTPLSSAVGVRRDAGLFLLDEIVLTSAVSKQSALEFIDKFKDHKNKHVLIYGDPAGQAGEKHGHASDYIDIEGVLKANGWSYTRKVKPAHPAIKDRQNAVRAKIRAADGARSLFVNPVTAKWCDKGLATVQLQDGSTFQEDQKSKYQHITTAIGYCVDVEWPAVKRIATVAPLRM